MINDRHAKANTNRTIESLKADAAKIQKRIDRDHKTLHKLRDKIATKERAAKLQSLVDVSDGVTISCHARESLRGKTGTVRKVNRTKAIVEIGGEPWTFPFELLHTDAFCAELTALVSRQGVTQ